MEGEGRKSAIPHIAALDGARGLAVSGVLLFHGGRLLGGYLGVDFFFTLSGFLITSLLLAESSRTGSVGLGGFWARRARRLLPALAVLMVGVALYSWAVASPAQLSQIRGDAFATLAYVANWHEIFSHTSYFALFSSPSPLNHTWSLAIEEQFYVIWPLVFVVLLTRFKRSTPKAVFATSLALAGISSVLMVVLYDPSNSNRSYFGTDTRAAAILFGAALAAWLAMRGPVTSRKLRAATELLGIAGASFLALAWTRLGGQSSILYRGGFLLCGLAATAVIAAAIQPGRGAVSRVLAFKPLCALGLISYGVYLYHWPIDVYLDKQRVGFGGWPLFAVQTAVTLTIAIASYRFIEQPIRRGAGSNIEWRKLTPAIAIGLVAAILLGTLGAHSIPETHIDAAALATPVFSAAIAFNSAAPGTRRVMIVGNSVAYSLGPGFRHVHADPPIASFDGGVPACVFPPEVTAPPVFAAGKTVQRAPCHARWEATVVNRFHPDVVFWIVSDGADGGVRYKGHTLKSCEEPYESIYRDSLRREITRLGARGAKVVITTEAYARYIGTRNVDRDTDCNNRIRREVARATGATLIDLFSFVCPKGQCRTTQDGVTLRIDGQHYIGPGGDIVAQWLMDQLDGRG